MTSSRMNRLNRCLISAVPCVGKLYSRLGGMRFSSAGNEFMGDRNVHIFDRALKAKQRDRAAWLMNDDDPVLSLVTENLLDRLDDCMRKFPNALNLGGAVEHVRRLLRGRGGIETLTSMDTSPDMVRRSMDNLAAEMKDGVDHSSFQNVHLVGDEEQLPFKEGSLDLIISSLGMHWVNDLPGAIIQCRRALKPDGFFLASMFGGETLRELRIACTCAQLEREGGVSPRISPLAQVRDAGNLLTRAGLALPAVDVDTFTVRYPSVLDLIEHLRSMGEINAISQRHKVLRKDTAVAAAAIYEAMFGEEDGSVPATFQVIYLAGWCPHPVQQKPKRRGSATVSFEDLQTALEKDGNVSHPKNTVEQTKLTNQGGDGAGDRSNKSRDQEETVHLPSGGWYTIR